MKKKTWLILGVAVAGYLIYKNTAHAAPAPRPVDKIPGQSGFGSGGLSGPVTRTLWTGLLSGQASPLPPAQSGG